MYHSFQFQTVTTQLPHLPDLKFDFFISLGLATKLRSHSLSLALVTVNGRAMMLRIGVHDDNEATSFTVEGKLTAPASTELEKCWQALITENPSRPVVGKLAAVMFIDFESRELLARMRRKGAKLVPTGCLMKAIVAQIEADVATDANSPWAREGR